MRLVETPWGKMLPHEVVKRFLDLSMDPARKEGGALRDLLFKLWNVSPEDGKLAAGIALNKRWPSPVRELAGEILLEGPVVEELTERVTNVLSLKGVFAKAKDGDELVFSLKEEEAGLLALAELWRRLGDTLSAPRQVDDFIVGILKRKHLPSLEIPFAFSVTQSFPEHAEWFAPKIYFGVETITLLRRAKPLSEDESIQ